MKATKKWVKENFSVDEILAKAPLKSKTSRSKSIIDFSNLQEVVDYFNTLEVALEEVSLHDDWDDVYFMYYQEKELTPEQRVEAGAAEIVKEVNKELAKKKKEAKDRALYEKLKKRFGE